MDLDILEMVELACQKDSEDEDTGSEDGAVVEDVASSSTLDALRGRVEENLKLLSNSAPVDASPLLLSDLREKFPQVGRIIYVADFPHGWSLY